MSRVCISIINSKIKNKKKNYEYLVEKLLHNHLVPKIHKGACLPY